MQALHLHRAWHSLMRHWYMTGYIPYCHSLASVRVYIVELSATAWWREEVDASSASACDSDRAASLCTFRLRLRLSVRLYEVVICILGLRLQGAAE